MHSCSMTRPRTRLTSADPSKSIRIGRRSIQRLALIGLSLAGLLAGTGCSLSLRDFGFARDGGQVEVRSLGSNPVVLTAASRSGMYSFDAGAESTFMLTDLTVDELLGDAEITGSLMHVELLWTPRPGATPMDSTATNLAIRFVVLAAGEVGGYEGGGFGLVGGTPGDDVVSINLRDTNLVLTDATPGFNDLLTPARITGSFSATRDERATHRLDVAASQLLTNRLGRPKRVMAQ